MLAMHDGRCPACRKPLPMTGVMPETVWINKHPPFELKYDCPACGVRLHEKGPTLTVDAGRPL